VCSYSDGNKINISAIGNIRKNETILAHIQDSVIDFFDSKLTNIYSFKSDKVDFESGLDVFSSTDFVIHNFIESDTLSIVINSKIVKEIPDFWGWVLDDNLVIRYNEKSLTVRKSFRLTNLLDTETYFEFRLPEDFTIFGNVQVMGNILFIDAAKNVNEQIKIYGLDILTGKTIWELHYQIPYDTKFAAYNYNKEDGLCYGYGSDLYQVFNPANGEILLSKDMTEYYELAVSPNPRHNTIADNRLWFVGNSRHSGLAKFGAVNIKTSEMEFVQDFQLDKGGQFDKPVYHNGKLYLLDSWNKILYVFE